MRLLADDAILIIAAQEPDLALVLQIYHYRLALQKLTQFGSKQMLTKNHIMGHHYSIFSVMVVLIATAFFSPKVAHGELISVYQGGVFQGHINAYTGALSGSANYNAFSSSGHPISGPSQSPREAQIFLYAGSDGLNFNFLFGQEGSGVNHHMDVDFNVSGSTTDPVVRLFDDPVELTEPAGTNLFQGRWTAGDNTDGGVIGEIGGDAWTIDVDVVSYSNIDSLRIYDSSGSFLSLDLNTVASGIITFAPVPEPGTFLLCTGVALLSFATWRKPNSRRQRLF